jgi:hypothetical protein
VICAETLGPGLAGLSAAIQQGTIAGSQLFAEYCQSCPKTLTTAAYNAAIKAIDDKAMCQVMCCCKNTQYRQECVKETLDKADDLLGGKSRYKAEISYNMRVNPPTPFMHRENGVNTTRRSEYWQTRAANEIPGYQSGAGHVRRPDVVIVNDPEKPPTRSNINRIVEMKFAGDTEGYGQYDAYRQIAGPRGKFDVIEQDDCDCNDQRGKKLPLPIPVQVTQRQKAPDGKWYEIPVWGVVTAVAAVATVAAFLVPFDGPLGEAAAGSATVASAARFAAAWGRVFGPAAAAAGAH